MKHINKLNIFTALVALFFLLKWGYTFVPEYKKVETIKEYKGIQAHWDACDEDSTADWHKTNFYCFCSSNNKVTTGTYSFSHLAYTDYSELVKTCYESEWVRTN